MFSNNFCGLGLNIIASMFKSFAEPTKRLKYNIYIAKKLSGSFLRCNHEGPLCISDNGIVVSIHHFSYLYDESSSVKDYQAFIVEIFVNPSISRVSI